MSTATTTETDLEIALREVFEDLWAVIVHNDDVTTFHTVIEALMSLFGHDEPEAERLAMIVHTAGKAVVAVLDEDKARLGVEGLHAYKIQATMTPA